jgi:riboflavin synthase
MFTGIVEAVGRLERVAARGSGARLGIHTGELPLVGMQLGDSIAVQGVCLTVIQLATAAFSADVSAETLACSTLGQIQPGAALNLERAVTPSTRLGGHLVSGHVDGVGVVLNRQPDGDSLRFHFEAPSGLAHYIARKGSITVDGVSLTVNAIAGAAFDINLVPHTLGVTTLGGLTAGARVNLEVDVVARYLERLLQAGQGAAPAISREALARAGFIR